MKIIQTYSETRQSPLSLLVEERIAQLALRGHVVGALAANGTPIAERFVREDSGVSLQTSRFSLGSSFSIPVKIQRLIGSGHNDFTVVHCPTIQLADKALLACKATGRHARVIYEPSTGITAHDNALSRHVLDLADIIILPSQTDADLLMGSGASVSTDRIRVLHPGVMLPPVARQNDDEAPEIERPDELTLIWAGEIVEGCGLDTLIEALGRSHHLHIHLIVAGQGPGRYVMPIIRRSKSLGIDARIEWAGNTAPTPSLVEKADVGVITAPHSPSAIYAAAVYMAYGLPVMWSDGPLARETIMPDVDGVIVGHTSDDWSASLHAMMADCGHRCQLGHDARAKAEAQFDINKHIEGLITTYLSLNT